MLSPSVRSPHKNVRSYNNNRHEFLTSLPYRLFEEDGEERDANATTRLGDDLDKLAPSLEILTQHEIGRLPRHSHPDAQHKAVAVNKHVIISFTIL